MTTTAPWRASAGVITRSSASAAIALLVVAPLIYYRLIEWATGR